MITHLNWTNFSQKYKPIKNTFVKEALCDGHLFEDKELLKDVKSDKIWTLIDPNNGEDMYITNGLKIINSLGYLVTLEPFENNLTIEVRLEKEDYLDNDYNN